jgi:hypothetical protein
MEIFETIEEELLVLPKGFLSLKILINTQDQMNHSVLFKEIERKDGSRILKMKSSEYLIIEGYNADKSMKERVSISYFHIATLKSGFRLAKKFFEDTFEYGVNNNIIIKRESSGGFKINNLIKDKSLLFVPCVMSNDDGRPEAFIEILVSRPGFGGIIPCDSFFQLCEFIEYFDLYSASKSLINTMLVYCNYGPSAGNTFRKNRDTIDIPAPEKRK